MIIPFEHFFRSESLHIRAFHCGRADGTFDVVPHFGAKLGFDPCAKTLPAYVDPVLTILGRRPIREMVQGDLICTDHTLLLLLLSFTSMPFVKMIMVAIFPADNLVLRIVFFVFLSLDTTRLWLLLSIFAVLAPIRYR
jgi:hypothetical protein